MQQTCQSLPYGNGESCPATPTEELFTGKKRDAESGNDYFGARYYASTMGRFMSPDWSAKVAPVPYAKLDDPQSLNLYAYVRNNPLAGIDADGHDWIDGAGIKNIKDVLAAEEVIFHGIGDAQFAAEGGAALQTNARAFDAIWNNYPSHEAYESGKAGTSGESIQQLTGVDVGDTCALRMSYALNQSGFSISKEDGKSAMLGSDGKYYLVGQEDVGKFITKNFGTPQNIGKAGIAGFDQSATGSGFVRFSIHFAREPLHKSAVRVMIE